MSDTQNSIGHVLDGRGWQRDAIHIAVLPAVAKERLEPGQRIAIDNEHMATGVLNINYPDAVAIVDPFLRFPVQEGIRFWAFMLPNTITNLRHHWTHPRIAESAGEDSELMWAKQFANSAGRSYEVLLEDCRHFAQFGETMSTGQDESWSGLPIVDWERWWAHVEKVTGVKHTGGRYAPYYCAC